MQQGGFMDDDLFQATCIRASDPPFILESFNTLQDAVPVLGASLAYALLHTHQSLHSHLVLQPSTVPSAQTTAYEALTLEAVQRCRRIARVLSSCPYKCYTQRTRVLKTCVPLMGNPIQCLRMLN
jgi:hypothetical protein